MSKSFSAGKISLSQELIDAPTQVFEGLRQISPGSVEVGVPIQSAQVAKGIMQLFVQRPQELKPGEMRVLQLLTDVAGTAIQRMRQHEQTKKQHQRMKTLHEMVR